MTTDTLARSYAEIVKYDKHGDGTLTVYGKATDDALDIDQQICDAEWLDRAMPEWFKSGGNIREQHSNIAAGVAQEYERKDDGHYISALVVDPVSVKKVEARVLKGFSIGIKAPRVVRDQKAANGRIIDGQIVEVSLVDRPANPNAKLVLAKAADGGELEQVEELTETSEVTEPVEEANGGTPEALETAPEAEGTPEDIEKRDVSTEEREELAERGAAMPDGSYPIANEADLKNAIQAYGRAKDPAAVKRHIIRRARALGAIDQLPEDWNVKKNAQIVEDFIAKFDKPAFDAARDAIARLIEVEANEVAQGHDERLSLAHLLEALNHLTMWYEGEAHEGEVGGVEVAVEHEHEEIELAAAPDAEDADADEKCDKCDQPLKMCKCDKTADAEKSADAETEPESALEVSDPADEAEPEVVEEIVAKAVAAATKTVRAEVADLIAAKEAAENEATGLKSQLAEALTKAAGGGPRRTGRTSPDSLNDNLVKAANYRAKASAATDPVLAKGYRALADEFASKTEA